VDWLLGKLFSPAGALGAAFLALGFYHVAQTAVYKDQLQKSAAQIGILQGSLREQNRMIEGLSKEGARLKQEAEVRLAQAEVNLKKVRDEMRAILLAPPSSKDACVALDDKMSRYFQRRLASK